MKQSWEWNEDDILSLIDEREKENLFLDYKACAALVRNDDKKKNEVSKDISSFANSAGGTIIYGVIENGNVPISIDVGYNPTDITKEWLEQVINSRIQPRIDGVIINQVELNKTNPGNVIYVVYIPQSKRAPHMASDKRYYKRFNFESVPMEEYEVRDVINRITVPDLKITLATNETKLQFPEGKDESTPFYLDVNAENESPTPAEYSSIKLYIDNRIKVLGGNFNRLNEDINILIENNPTSLTAFSKNFGIPNSMPLWQGVQFIMGRIQVTIPKQKGNFVILWQAYSPRMQQKNGLIFINSNGEKFTIVKI